MTEPEATPSRAKQLATTAANKALRASIEGIGPFKPATVVAEEALRAAGGDPEQAIQRLIRTHTRIATTNGAVSGLGGSPAQLIMLPVGVGGYYLIGARMTAAIAHLRGHDLDSDDVRSAVVVVMLGGFTTVGAREAGVKFGTKAAAEGLKRVPGKVFINVNKKVGFRLITKAGKTGIINGTKVVPLLGAPIGGGVDWASIRAVAKYAKSAFEPPTTSGTPRPSR